MTSAAGLRDAIRCAIDARAVLIERLRDEGTDCWRIFHGVSEGRPGLAVDQYGDLVLAQTFREPLELGDLDAIRDAVGCDVVWNHRGQPARGSTADRSAEGEAAQREAARAGAAREHVVHEMHAAFAVRARHRGLDPWLFLDLRAGRRALVRSCAGKRVLNLFAYTGSAGITALVHGALEAWNVDFARSSLAVAERNAELNGIAPQKLVQVEEDVFPVARQLAGLPVKGRASARAYVRVPRRSFDVVFLDPPASSKSAFGAVDVARDYPALFKPALLTLADGGMLIATNHVASVSVEAWRDVLVRCAEKAGRPLADVEMIAPDADFPAFDGRAPLKIAICRPRAGERME